MKGEPDPCFHNSDKPERHPAVVEDISISGVIQFNFHIGWYVILGPKDTYGDRVFQHMSKSSHFSTKKRERENKRGIEKP